MDKTSSIIVIIVLLTIFGFVFFAGSKTNNARNSISVENSEIRNGVQYITITAGGGYSPKISSAKAGIPTKLIMKTSGAYDCSLSLAIHSIGYQNILPQTGETEIDLGTPKAGEPLQGVCGMGMYNFLINFNQ